MDTLIYFFKSNDILYILFQHIPDKCLCLLDEVENDEMHPNVSETL